MSWQRLFGISLAFEAVIAFPFAFWLAWQTAFKNDPLSIFVGQVLVPAIVIVPLCVAAISYLKGSKA